MKRNKFARRFKIEAVSRREKDDVNLANIAREFDINEDVLRRWAREFSADPLHAVAGTRRMRPKQSRCSDADGQSPDLREQNRRFDAALNNMSQGLCMFDADQRMIVCNEKYLSLFSSDPAVVKPGVTLLEIFQHGIANGIYPGLTADELLVRRLARVAKGISSVYDQKMADGRTIEILVSPMADGGWVATFADVTEIRRMEAERAAAVAEVRQRNLLLDATLESMGKGLCVFDQDACLLIHNQRYLDLFGFDIDVVRPGTLMLDLIGQTFQDGIDGPHADAIGCSEDLRQCLTDKRAWLVNRRLADGRIVAMSVRPMAQGGWISTVEDITERERAAEELRIQHRRFDAALRNMSHGLSMFDEHLNLIVCNSRYLEIYGLSADIVKPGATMENILTHAAAVIPETLCDGIDRMIERHVAQLAAGNHLVYRELADGRTVKVVHTPMADGGWVAIHEDVTEKKRAERYIAYMASHDALTDLANRTLFRQRMEDAIARVTAGGAKLAVLYVDLDNFKTINDTCGHSFGDRLLCEVADRLRSLTSDEDTVARLGGDEFAILKFASTPREVAAFAQSLISILSETIIIDDSQVRIGASIGIVIAPADDAAPAHLMNCADLALYRAKSEGRGTFCFFEPEMEVRAQIHRSLELDLGEALARNEFHLVFQPLVRVSDQELIGFEALLRWDRPGHGLVPPADFIPIAEKTGLIIGIGEWVVREACSKAAKWPEPITLAVNLSPVQFKKRGLVAMITNALASSGLAPDRLELEITEAVLLQDDNETGTAISQLRALGTRISIDDFGVGYSTLSYLRSFPFDKIKIDRCFVSDLEGEGKNFAILRAIADLGASLGVKTVAEGVETEAQLELVRRAGCSELQGYLMGRPQDEASVLQTIKSLCPRALWRQDAPTDKEVSRPPVSSIDGGPADVRRHSSGR